MGVIIFPTDTVYGIGCSIYNKEDQLKIYEIKRRPLDKPLAVLCASLEQIEQIAYLQERDKKIISAFMPGALTIIVKAKEDISQITGFANIGVRVPNYQVAIDILNYLGPMTTTSVNESGQSPINDYNLIKEQYDRIVDTIIPPSAEETSKVASTVIDLSGDKVCVLREGEITLKQIMHKISE